MIKAIVFASFVASTQSWMHAAVPKRASFALRYDRSSKLQHSLPADALPRYLNVCAYLREVASSQLMILFRSTP
jgi:hypothetical protein